MLQLVSSKKSSAENKRYEEISRAWRRDPDKESHIFTGKGRVPLDGKSWQLCDLEDPVLKKLVDLPDLQLRERCEERYFGWYHNGTWCKLKIILKAKIDLMMEGIDAVEEGFDVKFDRLLNLPESYTLPARPDEVPQQQTAEDSSVRRDTPSLWKSAGRNGDPILGFLPRNASKLELEWAAQYRALCRAPQGKLPNSGRLSKSKAQTRGSYVQDRREDTNGETSRHGSHSGSQYLNEDGILGERRGRSTGGTRCTTDGEDDEPDDEIEEVELELEEEEEGDAEDEAGLELEEDEDEDDER